MSRVVVLGGCGAVGRVASLTLANTGTCDELVVADLDGVAADRLVGELIAARGASGVAVRSAVVDVTDQRALQDLVRGADVVLNCVGPFYRSVRHVFPAVLELGIDYVDVCDDVDATLDLLALDERAKDAEVTALIGMGASPGVTNLFARYLVDHLLDRCESVDVFHTHGGEPVEGAGVIAHRFHCMSGDIPVYLDGELRSVRYFEHDGIALRQTFDFPLVGDDVPIFPYPHPEQITLPQHLDLRRVTNKGSVLPIEYYELTAELCRIGVTSTEPLEVDGARIVPHDFAIAFLLRERERMLTEAAFGEQRGCISVVVCGSRAGEPREYRMHMASSGRALGEGTGIPAALGVMMMQRGSVSGPGVVPPEAGVAPDDFLALADDLGLLRGDDASGTLLVEEVAPDGAATPLDL